MIRQSQQTRKPQIYASLKFCQPTDSLEIQAYLKTCVIRRDKTLLRALRVDMHARQWVTGLHLAAQTTGDEGGWKGGGLSGGLLQKGVIAAFMHAASSYLVQ